jgi:hypothetical protein
MDTQALAELACRKLGLPADTPYTEIKSLPRSGGYRSKLGKTKGMTLVLTQDPKVKDKLIADGWNHRGYVGGDVLFKVI